MAHFEGIPGLPEDLVRMIAGGAESTDDKIKRWREEMEKQPGMRDTVLISRIDFREILSRTLSEAGGNNPKPGPLFALNCLLGRDGTSRLDNLYGGIIEEALFGSPGGEKPRNRTDFGESENEYKIVVSGMSKTLGNFARDKGAEAGEKSAGFGEFVTAAIQSFGELVAENEDFKAVGAYKAGRLFIASAVKIAANLFGFEIDDETEGGDDEEAEE